MIWENGKLLTFVLANIKLKKLDILSFLAQNIYCIFTISLYDIYATLTVIMSSSIVFFPYISIYYRFRERASLYLEQTDKCCETEK